MTTEDKVEVERLCLEGKSARVIGEMVGCTTRQVNNYLHGQGLKGSAAKEIGKKGIDKQWLLDNAKIDIRKRARAIRKALGTDFKEQGITLLYWDLCRVDGSPEPYRGKNCETCIKRELCSGGYVRCESIQDWEGRRGIEDIYEVIESNKELYEDCYAGVS